MLKLAIAGGVGFVLGLYAAKLYARNKVKNTVDDFLTGAGLGGGAIQSAADSFIPSYVIN